jgi:hypothetical protein
LRKIEDISEKMAAILDQSETWGGTNPYSMIFSERKRIRGRVRRRKTEIRN